MTVRYRTRGFVFKKTDHGEADRVFSIFTKNFGRLEITGKAIRKITSKLRAGIDIFYLSEIEFIQGRNRKTLTDASPVKNLNGFTGDFQKIKLAHQVAELIDDFIKGQEKDKKTFELLENFFGKLYSGKKINNYQLAFHYFFWNLASLQGYKLETKVCAACRGKLNPNRLYFSAKEGGIICNNCFSTRPDLGQKINADVVKILRLILSGDWQTFSKLKVSLASQNLLEATSQTALRHFLPVHS